MPHEAPPDIYSDAPFDLEAAVLNHDSWQRRRDAASAGLVSTLFAKSYDEIRDLEPPDWLVPDLFQKAALHIIAAPQQTYKTWLALHALHSGHTGVPMLGMPISLPFNSLYLAADSTYWDLSHQLRQIARATGHSIPRGVDTRFIPFGFNLLNRAHVEAAAEYIVTHDVHAFFFDVLLYAHTADENSNSEMPHVFRAMKYLRDYTGAAVIALHHMGHGAERARGASTITQAVEHVYYLKKNRSTGVVTLARDKMRGEAAWQTLQYNLKSVNEGLMLVPESGEIHPLQTWLTPSPLTRQALLEMTHAIGKSTAWLDKHLTNLRKLDVIETNGKGLWRLKGV